MFKTIIVITFSLFVITLIVKAISDFNSGRENAVKQIMGSTILIIILSFCGVQLYSYEVNLEKEKEIISNNNTIRTFNIGDVVKLKSGSPNMTITDTLKNVNISKKEVIYLYQCKWYNNDYVKDNFKEKDLIKVDNIKTLESSTPLPQKNTESDDSSYYIYILLFKIILLLFLK